MRILQVFDFFSPLHGGGTVDIIHKLSKTLVQRGHIVTICTSDYELDKNYINSLKSVEVTTFHCWLNLFNFYIIPSVIRFDVRHFDVIHFHCLRSFQNVVLSYYARKHRVPHVIDAHGSAEKLKGAKQLLKRLYDNAFGYRILRGASQVIAETEVGASEYRQLGVDSSKITIIHPPFEIGEFAQLPPRGLFKSKYGIMDKHIILFLGRIHWVKGLDFLVKSFYELCQVRNDTVLVVVGIDDGYKSTLMHMIESLNLSSKVLFTGFLSGEAKLLALVDADVLVQSSIYEQGARPSFEALLCNTPIIVTRDTGAGEDVTKIDAGYLVEYGNTKELSQAINYVITHSEEAEVKTQRAKEWVKDNLSLGKQVDKYEQLYKEVIEK